MIERRVLFRVAGMAGASAAITGAAACSSEGAGSGDSAGQAAEPPRATISAEPAAEAKDVAVTQPVTVRVTEGTFAEVTVTNQDGEQVRGELNPERTEWASREPLGFGTTYTYRARATGTDNKPVEFTGTFATINPEKQVRATLNPADDAEVGVAMPISVKFDSAVSDRAAAQQALSVETSNGVEGAWAWLSNRQVDWRPKEYWPTGTKVTVTAKLYGVPYGGGKYGKADVSTEFTIGRNQVVKINTPDHVMKVYRDDAEHASYPCSNGKDAKADLNTPNGTVVVMSKEPTAIFDNARYGYTDVEKKWAVRISNHGEFIHENEENRSNIGKRNTSHGCVNLYESDAKEYFRSALVGDPVEITGSKASMPQTSDIMDWLMDWETWKSKSAV